MTIQDLEKDIIRDMGKGQHWKVQVALLSRREVLRHYLMEAYNCGRACERQRKSAVKHFST